MPTLFYFLWRIMSLEDIFIKIDDISRLMYMNEVADAFNMLAEYMPYITEYLNAFISNIPKYNELGADIPQNVVLTQISNLFDGIENKDVLLIADTLKYEILPSLQVYNEISAQI